MDAALTPTWDEIGMASRVRRHTKIVRSLAHELSTAPDRPDRPATAAAARARWDAHLAELARILEPSIGGFGLEPQVGTELGPADTPPISRLCTTDFIAGLLRRAARYSDHLFHCFEDARIPASTNGLERFFGVSKRILRHAVGCGSTTNTVVANLGAEPLLALQQMRQPSAMQVAPLHSPADFEQARRKIAVNEAPAIRRRSLVRHFDRHLHRLRSDWLKAPGRADGASAPAELYA